MAFREDLKLQLGEKRQIKAYDKTLKTRRVQAKTI